MKALRHKKVIPTFNTKFLSEVVAQLHTHGGIILRPSSVLARLSKVSQEILSKFTACKAE